MMALFANAHRRKGQKFKADDFLPAEPREREGATGEELLAKFDAWAEARN